MYKDRPLQKIQNIVITKQRQPNTSAPDRHTRLCSVYALEKYTRTCLISYTAQDK